MPRKDVYRIATLATWLCISLAAAIVRAEEPKAVYQPAGAPADPRIAAHWNRYHDYADATRLLQELVKAHPDHCRLQSLGKSYGNREMWVMTLANFKDGKKESEKPAFWIDGGIHANEIQASEVALYTAWFLLESYDRSPLVTRLLNERVFYIMPMMSPDSRDSHMHEPNTTSSPRSGQRPIDDDRDGLVDEDRPDDLDGDGHITEMRIRDPHGRFKPHPDFPDLMVPAEPDEAGEFRLLGIEGFDNDGDGLVNEDDIGVYDPNRDWAWGWQPRAIQRGAYRYPFSILENRLVADFVMAHPHIAGAQSYHNSGGMVLRGPGIKGESYEPADTALLKQIAQKGELMLPGYRSLQTADDLYEVFGGELDWLYKMQGVCCFTNELFTPFNFFRKKSDDSIFGKRDERQLFNKYLLLGDGTVAWHEVVHPQYGKIEVGGLKKNWMRQPPSFLLEEECHRNMAFTLYHADQLPQVSIEAVIVKPEGDNLFSVTATVVNPKLTPTRMAVDVKNKLSPADVVTLAGPEIKIIAGVTDSSFLFDHPQEQRRRPAEMQLDTIGGLGAVYVRWLVQGHGAFTVSVRTTKGGVAQLASQLPEKP